VEKLCRGVGCKLVASFWCRVLRYVMTCVTGESFLPPNHVTSCMDEPLMNIVISVMSLILWFLKHDIFSKNAVLFRSYSTCLVSTCPVTPVSLSKQLNVYT